MDDSWFGPRLLGHFDFTLLFEHSIFQIGPSLLIIFSTPFYIYKMLKGTAVVRSGLLLYSKLACAAALIAVQLANLVLWSTSSVSDLNAQAARSAASLSFIGALCIATIIYSGHRFFLEASPVLGLLLTVTLPLDIVTAMSYYHRVGLEQIARLSVAIPVLKFVILLLEELSKRSLIRDEEVRTSLGGEAVAGFWNKSLFMWLNPILLFGFRNTITRNYLPSLTPHLAAEPLYQRFSKQWEKRKKKTSKFALAICCLATCPWPFLYIILPRALVTGFSFSQPFLLHDVVNQIQTDTSSNDVQRGLIVATAIIYVGIAVSRSWYAYTKSQLTVSVRAMLISAVYHKTLRLSAEELKKTASITLVNTDVAAVEQLVSFSYDTCASAVEVALGLTMLVKSVGTAAIFAFIPTLITTLVASFLTKPMVAARLNWNSHTTKRVQATSNILAQSKEIKMLGLGPYIARYLQGQFEDEMRATTKDRDFFMVSLTLAACADSITPVLVVAGTLFWTRASETLTSAQFFTTLAFVKLVSGPLGIFLEYLPYWATGFASLQRVQEFLAKPERVDARTIVVGSDALQSDSFPPALSAAVHSSPTEKHSTENLSANPSNTSDNEDLTSRATSTAVTALSAEKSETHHRAIVPINSLEVVKMSINTDSGGFILQDVSLSIGIGKLAMIAGPVGCGKSTFLRAILGEMKPSAGQIKVAGEVIAYCSQRPWIRNTTLQKNVIGQNIYNAARYNRVIYICALDVDFAQLPEGDQSMAGTDGCNLSGGQRARISLARALYLEGDMLLLDDVFSALDNATSATVRSRLFASERSAGTRPITIIMVTNNTEHLRDADVIYRIDQNGHMEEAPRTCFGSSTTSIHAGRDGSSGDGIDETIKLPAVKPSTKEEDADDKVDTTKSDFSLYTYFIGPAGIPYLIIEGFVLIVAAIGERMPQIFGRIWMDNNAASRLYFIGFAVFGLANPILHVVSIVGWFHLINASASNALHWRLAHTAMEATFEFLMAEDANFLLNRFSVDISMANQSLSRTMVPVLWCGLMILIDVGVIAAGASYAAPIIPCFLLVVYLVQRFYLGTSRQLRSMELDNAKLLTRHLSETSGGIEVLRAAGASWRDAFVRDFYGIIEVTLKPVFFLYTIQQWLRSVMDLTSAVCAVIMVTIALQFKNSASPGSVGLALLSLITFSETAALFIRFYVTMEMASGSVARIRAFAQGTPLEKDGDAAAAVPKEWPQSGQLEMSGVTAVYKPDSDKPHTALDNMSVSIQSGDTVGLVGRTGSGKSSVLLAFLRLVTYSGQITLDGVDITAVPRDRLRRSITTITQAGLELNGSVRFNLDPFKFGARPAAPNTAQPYPTDDDLTETLREVGLWDLVSEAGGLDATMLDLKLSHGQRQLFQLARAVVHHRATGSRVLLMDEGTASMDEETEVQVKRVMADAFAGCTKVIISHRPALLAEADLVVRLDHGKAETTRSGQNKVAEDEEGSTSSQGLQQGQDD